MKTLKILIRLHKKQLDDLLRKINKLEEQKDNLAKTLSYLEEQAKKELEEYYDSPYAFMLEKYLQNFADTKKQLTESIGRIDKLIETLRHELQDKFAELKKFEIALAKERNKQQILIRAAETKSLDEFNVSKFNLTSINRN
jgi:flagellar FliJ protein